MDASEARKRLREIGRSRSVHEEGLMRMRGELVSGSLVSRYTKCMRPGCKCGKGEPHGPFLYLSRKESGRTKWIYIGKASEGRLASAVKRYKAFSDHVRELKRLAEEASECYSALATALEVKADSLKGSQS